MAPGGDARGKDDVGTCGTGAPFEHRLILGCKPNASMSMSLLVLNWTLESLKGRFSVTVGHGATGNKA